MCQCKKYFSEIDKFVELTHHLKMVSIPARIVEKNWERRFPVSKKAPRPSADEVPKAEKKRSGRPRPSRSAKVASPAPIKSQSPPPSPAVTRCGRRVVPRRFEDEIVGDVETAEVVTYPDKFASKCLKIAMISDTRSLFYKGQVASNARLSPFKNPTTFFLHCFAAFENEHFKKYSSNHR